MIFMGDFSVQLKIISREKLCFVSGEMMVSLNGHSVLRIFFMSAQPFWRSFIYVDRNGNIQMFKGDREKYIEASHKVRMSSLNKILRFPADW